MSLLPACAALAALLALPGASRAQEVRSDLYVTNGPVYGTAESQGVLYIGGDFTSVGTPTGCALAFDPTTGLPLSLPGVAGRVYAVAPDGAGGWYLGGDFTHVGGVARSNIAHIQADQTLSSWDPSASGLVRALAVSGDTVFVGGSFTNIGGQSRDYIAALSVTTGLAFAGWDAGANGGTVSALVLNGSTLYVGGGFNTIGGEPRSGIAALDAGTALATSWDPGGNGPVYDLAVQGSLVYVGGDFTSIGGYPRSRIAAIDAGTGGATSWDPGADDQVLSVAASGNTVYAGGLFNDIGGQAHSRIAALDATTGLGLAWDPNPSGAGNEVEALAVEDGTVYVGGSFTTIGGAARNNIASIDSVTGAATPWNPDLNQGVFDLAVTEEAVIVGGQFTSVGAQPRHNLAAIDLETGMVTSWNPGAFGGVVNALAAGSGVLYAGGTFTSAGGQLRDNLAALSTITGLATAWAPNANDAVRALVVDGSTVYAGGDFQVIDGQFHLYLASLDAGTGSMTGWNPLPDGPVHALALGAGGVVVGGSFGSIGGASRINLAAIDPGSGMASSWDPGANGIVRALLAPQGGPIYAGGDFTSIGGQSRNRVAALDTTSGSALSWDPLVSGGFTVRALAGNGSTVYLGGNFTSVGGLPRYGLAAVHGSTGLPLDWDPKARVLSSVYALSLVGSDLYVGGSFQTMGGRPQSYLAGIGQVQSITSVAPNRGGNDGGISLVVTGTGFRSGAVPWLTRAGESPIIGLQPVVAPDSQSVTATFDLIGKALGSWDVRVVNPDMSYAELQDAFTIEIPLAQQLRVDVIGPTLIRANHKTSYDIVIQNLGSNDLLTVPLWISRIPDQAVVTIDSMGTSLPAEVGEPDWSLAPLTLDGTAGRYMVFVIPRVPPGFSVRRVTLTVPAEVTEFGLDAALTPPWVNIPPFLDCLAAGEVINAPGCVGAQLDEINDYLTTTPDLEWINAFGLWAKIAWQCEGAGSLGAALGQAEQVLGYMLQPIEMNGVPSGCVISLVPRWQDRRTVDVVTSIDPNDKIGPTGYGAEQEIGSAQLLPYSIRFENADSASAPAQSVIVIDQVDGDALDWSTMSFGPITFGDWVVYPPPGLYSYTTDLDLRPDMDLIVRVGAFFDYATGVLTWSLSSIDPTTGQPTQDPKEGFLPANVTPPEGEGSLMFTIMPNPALGGGASIGNTATIVFDGGDPIETPTWLNVLDATAPESQVLPLQSTQDSANFMVEWEPIGDPPDLRDFSVYVSENGGEYRAWRVQTTATADTFAGTAGQSYAFYSLARDSSGNLEAVPSSPDAETTTPVGVGEPVGRWQLALAGAVPNPAVGKARVWLTLPDRRSAVLEVMDVAGRRVWRRDVGALGPGRHLVDVSAATRQPGLYFLRLAQGGRVLRARMVFLR